VNPSVIQDEFFGALRWNDLVAWYESKIQIPDGREIEVSIKVGDDGPRASVEQARRDFPSVLANETSYREQTAAALLGTHNDHWNEGERIDIDGFMARMTLESIVFYVIYTELWYDDGDLFWGHSIVANLDSELRFTNATFEG
jgi:hypothetical protein